MTRLILALAVLLAGMSAQAAGLPAQLRTGAMVDGETIRLGDIWENLAERADLAVAAAPQPGKRVTLDARWLAAAAAAYGIDWRPASAFDRLVIERSGLTIEADTIEAELMAALAREGVPASSAIEIANRTGLRLLVPAGTPTTIGIRDMTYDPRVNRFSAVVEVPANAPAATRLRVSGRVFAMTRMPVLNRVVNRGEVIAHADLDWAEMREEAVRGEVATAFAQLVGQEPRHTLRPGVPVRINEVQRPVLVSRNSAVTMILKTPMMELSTQGKAVEEGARGDLIRVTNLHTKKIVEAKVEGPGLVSVAATGPRLLSN